jgi:hypothetical protein
MKYYLVRCEVKSNDFNEENYGILMVEHDKSREYACDISECAEDVATLVGYLNDYNVDLHQAREIIEDFKFNIK